MSCPGWDEHQAPWRSLMHNLNVVYTQEISSKRSEWTQAALNRAIETISVALSEANTVIGSTLATLKREQNRSAPVNMLPVELLCRIFQMASHYSAPQKLLPKLRQEPRPQNLVAISHTCSHWRTITLDAPQLWGTLHMDRMSEGLVALFRKRCDDRALVLDFEYSEFTADSQSRRDRFIHLWTMLSKSVRCLRYHTPGELEPSFTLAVLSDVSHTTLEHLETLDLWGAMTAITAELPNLRSLSVAGSCIRDRTASSLTKLTHLSLLGSEAMQMRTILTVLSVSPVLRRLELTSYGHMSDVDPSEFAETTIRHHSLTTLILRLPAKDINSILHHIAPVNFIELEIAPSDSTQDLCTEAACCIPDSVSCSNISHAWADSSCTEVDINHTSGRIEVRQKCWAAADPRRVVRVTLRLMTKFGTRRHDINVADIIKRVTRELLPRLCGHPMQIYPDDNTETSTQKTPSERHTLLHAPAVPRTVRLTFLYLKKDLRGVASALTSFGIQSLEISDASISAELLHVLSASDEALGDMKGKTIEFMRCSLHNLSVHDVSAAVQPLVRAGARLVFDDCKATVPGDNGSDVVFNWRSLDCDAEQLERS